MTEGFVIAQPDESGVAPERQKFPGDRRRDLHAWAVVVAAAFAWWSLGAPCCRWQSGSLMTSLDLPMALALASQWRFLL